MHKSLLIVACATSLLMAACSGSSSSPKSTDPSQDYQAHQQAFLDKTIEEGVQHTYGALVHLSQGVAPMENSFDRDLGRMNSREDTADFKLPGLLNILYKYANSELLDRTEAQQIEDTVINFKYWPDELETVAGTTDVKNMVFWTENHFILFSSGAYLAGQLYPDTVFPASGNTGREQMEIFKPRVLRWLELRYRSGFSEWLSNVYYNEDIPALMALIELAEDQEIVEKSKIVLDLMMADMALNNFQGNFGSTHGRTYTHKMSGSRDSTRGTMNLIFGLNNQNPGNMSAVLLALSEKYRLPEVLYRIAHDTEIAEMENRQRMGIRLEEAADWGLDLTKIEDGMTFLTMEPYTNPLFADLFYDLLNEYQWWDHRDFETFNDFRVILDDPESRAQAAEFYEWDITRNMRPEVNIYTYRTPDYMLSTAQDWRKGFGGDQASIWQATLGMDSVAFTTHPATEDPDSSTPNYWIGYGTLPRVAQVKNVVVSLYDVDTRDGLYYSNQPLYTLAYLPKAHFDEEVKDGNWFFAKSGDGYLALWSSDPDANWVAYEDSFDDSIDAGGEDYEIIANGEKTIWICELGDVDQYGNFETFKTAIKGASLVVDVETLSVNYTSPSQGTIVMAWDGAVMNNDAEVQLDDYDRYDNPYSQSAFPGDDISFSFEGSYLNLNFDTATRDASAYLE